MELNDGSAATKKVAAPRRPTAFLPRGRRRWRAWRRRRRTGVVAAVLAPRAAAGARDLMTLGIHALHVRAVVAALQLVPGRVGGAVPGTRSDDQARACTHCCAGPAAANQRAGGCADHGADCGVAYRGIGCGVFARGAATLIVGVLAALRIIAAELI